MCECDNEYNQEDYKTFIMNLTECDQDANKKVHIYEIACIYNQKKKIKLTLSQKDYLY